MKKINKYIEDAFINYHIEADNDDIDQILDEHIVDKEVYIKNREQHLKKINFLAKAITNQYKDQILLAKVAEKFHEAISKNVDAPVSFFKQMIQGHSTPAYYSNLNKLTKADIIEIIKDKNLVELLEKLEGDESKH